jgi:hypothetical protein
MFTISLGGVWPARPSTWRGTTVNAAVAAAAPLRKSRRDILLPVELSVLLRLVMFVFLKKLTLDLCS